MPTITFEPGHHRIQVPVGTRLDEAAVMAGVRIDAQCGGQGTCGRCALLAVSGKVDAKSSKALSREQVRAGYILACRSLAGATDLVIQLPEPVPEASNAPGAADDTLERVRPELLPDPPQCGSLVTALELSVPQPGSADARPDVDRLQIAVQEATGSTEPVQVSLPVLRGLASALRQDDGRVRVLMHQEDRQRCLLHVGAPSSDHSLYGVAVDLGTTSISVQLVSLDTGAVVATVSDYNDQTGCGADIISRINYARRPGHLQELRQRGLQTINRLISQAAERRNLEPSSVAGATIAGNTTMIHLLLGLNPEYIRVEPYTPTALRFPDLEAHAVGLDIMPAAPVFIAAGAGSYVGGDITAGLLCTEMATKTEKVSLFIDIGTNGELVVGNGEFLVACACSAGPAFEGSGIACGMRATAGAIESVHVDESTGQAHCRTIDAQPAAGICGSGMISLLAALFRTGWLDAGGRLARERRSAAIRVDGRHGSYRLVEAQQTQKGQAVMIDEREIQSVLRAKAAIYSASAMVLEQLGLGFGDLEHVYIGGGFGRSLEVESAVTIGLLPDLPRATFQFLGNASLAGAYMALVSAEHRRLLMNLAARMTYLELNTDPAYMDHYTAALFLPHTDPSRFPSVAAGSAGGGR